jgi:hypothetical protein
MTDPATPSVNSSNGPQPNRGWIWYFGIVGVLAVAAVAGLIWYNRSQQLTPQELAEAHARWDRFGPADYDMEYRQTGSAPETRKVRVRQGKVVWATRDGEPLEKRLYHYSDMPALFGFIEDFLREDAQPGKPRTFCTAAFDTHDGHLVHYIRRVMGTNERQEITVQLHPVDSPPRDASPTGNPGQGSGSKGS